MFRTISYIAAVAATLAMPTAAMSGGHGGGGRMGGGHMGGGHMGGGHMGGGHMGGGYVGGGAHMGGAPMRSFAAAGNFGGPRNFSTFNRGAFPRHAFFNRGRHFHHGRFAAPFFVGAGLGLYGYDYAYSDSCWRYQDVPTPWGYTTQRVWVCGDYDYGYGY
jgi:hypothetical protein